MTLLVFAPIIIVVALIGLYIIIAKKAVRIKNISRVLIMYILVLFVFTIIYFVVPKSEDQIEAVEIEEVYDLEEFDERANKMYSYLENGELNQVKDNIIAEQIYGYDGKELILEETPGIEEWLNIYIELKEQNDGVIKMTQVHTGTYVNNMDVTAFINPSKLVFDDGHLKFDDPEPVYLKKASFKKEFPITQFSREKDEDLGFSTSTYLGNNMIYIKIPKDTIVKNETSFDVQYVKK